MAPRASHSAWKSARSTWRPVSAAGRPTWWRQAQVPSGSWTELWRTPRRNDDTERVGLNWTVRSRISSKVANVSGPDRKAAMSDVLSPSTPGVMSTSRSRCTRCGCRVARAIEVAPPSDIPTTARASGAKRPTTWATSSAMEEVSSHAESWGQSECPWPGRSTARSGRSSARATVSHVWAFCPPPWTSTSSGGPSPQTRALTRRPGATSTDSRRTTGGPSNGRPASSAFSWKSENSS